LAIHESKIGGIYVEGLTEYAVNNYMDCLALMRRGERNRYIRQTSYNAKSSRSHTIFQLLLECTTVDANGKLKVTEQFEALTDNAVELQTESV
jgi:hypothetical protein